MHHDASGRPGGWAPPNPPGRAVASCGPARPGPRPAGRRPGPGHGSSQRLAQWPGLPGVRSRRDRAAARVPVPVTAPPEPQPSSERPAAAARRVTNGDRRWAAGRPPCSGLGAATVTGTVTRPGRHRVGRSSFSESEAGTAQSAGAPPGPQPDRLRRPAHSLAGPDSGRLTLSPGRTHARIITESSLSFRVRSSSEPRSVDRRS